MTEEERYFFALNGSKVRAGQKLIPTSRALAYDEIDCQYLLEKKKKSPSSLTGQLIFLVIYDDSQRKCSSCKRN